MTSGELGSSTPVTGWLLELFNVPDYRPPVLPKIAGQLLAISKNADLRISEIARLLEQDPMLTAVMLRIANSAVHRAGREVATIDEAIARLGMRRVTEIVLEAAVMARVFRAPAYGEVMEALRLHSAATAHVARMLSRMCGVDPSDAFVCGLLHDIGIAASLIAISDHCQGKDLPPIETVWDAIAAHHAATGALLQQSWGLPNHIGRILHSHHHPTIAEVRPEVTHSTRLIPVVELAREKHGPAEASPEQALLAVVSLADALVTELGAGMLDEMSAGAVSCAQDALGLDAGLLARARGNAQALLERLERD